MQFVDMNGNRFSHGKADLLAMQKYVADKLLEVDKVKASKYGSSMAGHVDSGLGRFLAWLGDDDGMIDDVKVN